jgi:nicotinate phosphoribosyltransferase
MFDSRKLTLLSLCLFGLGIRLDSGDLAYLSISVRKFLLVMSEKIPGLEWVHANPIVASNNINEDTLYSLKNQGHEINIFGVGTHLVTCQAQPALGCVFKLVQVNGTPRIKLSEDVEKVTLPGDKDAYRLYGKDGNGIVDLMMNTTEKPPTAGSRILCRHPFIESKRAHVVPAKVEKLHNVYFSGSRCQRELPTLMELRTRVTASLKLLRPDHLRSLNPTPYKVSVSEELYSHLHSLWLQNAPVGELM